MIIFLITGYLIIAQVIYNDYRKVKKNYNVQRNGFRYVIRNKQGKYRDYIRVYYRGVANRLLFQ